MARTYVIPFENLAVTGAIDLVSVKGSAGKTIKLKRVVAGMADATLQTAQGLRFRVRQMLATFTQGSGGTAPTPSPADPGDSAASFTALMISG